MNVMELLVAVIGVLLCGALLAAMLRTHRPELAMGLSLLAGAVVVVVVGRRVVVVVTTVVVVVVTVVVAVVVVV